MKGQDVLEFKEPETLADCAQLVVDELSRYVNGEEHGVAWDMHYFIELEVVGIRSVCLAGAVGLNAYGEKNFRESYGIRDWMSAIDSLRDGYLINAARHLYGDLDRVLKMGAWIGDEFSRADIAKLSGDSLHLETHEEYAACHDQWVRMVDFLKQHYL